MNPIPTDSSRMIGFAGGGSIWKELGIDFWLLPLVPLVPPLLDGFHPSLVPFDEREEEEEVRSSGGGGGARRRHEKRVRHAAQQLLARTLARGRQLLGRPSLHGLSSSP